MARFVVGLSLSLFVASFVVAQNPPVSDPRALTLAAQSIAAMTGGNALSDITLTGNVTWIAGSDIQTGIGNFLAKGTSQSRVDLTLSGGNRSDIRNSSSGFPQGAWIRNGTSIAYALHNCWTDAAWFLPALTSLSASDPSIVLSSVGLENRFGLSAHHLRAYRYVSSQSNQVTAQTQRLSTMEFYLDRASLLPLAVAFKVHPDNDMDTDIRAEVRFADYRAVNGVLVPFHIQRLVNDGLFLDVTLTSAAVNSGLPDSNFTVQ